MVTNAVAKETPVAIAGIVDVAHVMLAQVVLDVGPAKSQERAQIVAATAGNRTEPDDTGAANQSHQDGLGLVRRGVGEQHTDGAELGGDGVEGKVAGVARSRLEGGLAAVYIDGHRAHSGPASCGQPGHLLTICGRVRAQLMVDIDERQLAEPPGAGQAHGGVGERGRVGATRARHDDRGSLLDPIGIEGRRDLSEQISHRRVVCRPEAGSRHPVTAPGARKPQFSVAWRRWPHYLAAMNSGSDAPLSRLRARLARPRGYRRVEELISSDDPAAIAAIPVAELYALVREVGFGDCQELLAMATPSQFRGCFDLDLWDRDRVQMEAAKPWLEALIASGFEKLGTVWEALDNELTALIITRWTHIYDLSLGEEPPENDDIAMMKTPDTFFVVALTSPDEDTIALVQRLIEDLYRADPVLARHTLMSARSEVGPELEEMSYRWRSNRLADLGYVDFYEALEVFRPLDADTVVIGENSEDRLTTVAAAEGGAPDELPLALAERIVGHSFLARALAAIEAPEEAERIATAFVILTNKVLSALRISPGDEEGIALGADYVAATVSLGLETLAHGDIDRASTALGSVSLTRLHRLGYTATLRLSRIAAAVSRHSSSAGEPTATVIATLLGPRPLFAGELDDPSRAESRPLATLADVARVATLLAEFALRLAIANAIEVNTVALAEQEPGHLVDDYIRTALVRTLAGGALTPAPLAASELASFHARAVVDEKLTDAARELVADKLGTLLADAKILDARNLVVGLASAWANDIQESLAHLPADHPVDGRFVGVLVLGPDSH